MESIKNLLLYLVLLTALNTGVQASSSFYHTGQLADIKYTLRSIQKSVIEMEVRNRQ